MRLGDDARAALLQYSWPGNIRELENVIHYGLIVNSSGVIGAGDLRLRSIHQPAVAHALLQATVQHAPRADAPAADGLNRLAEVLATLFEAGGPELYERIERVLINTAYTHCQRNQVHTAELLGISRNVLRTQLKQFGLLPGLRTAPQEHEDLSLSAG